MIQDPAGYVNNVTINPQAQDVTGIVALSGANTYGGITTLGGGTVGGGGVLLGASSVVSGTNIVFGPFGRGKVITFQLATPPTLVPIGADRSVANPFMLDSGFSVANAASNAFSLTLTGPMGEPVSLINTTIGITNSMVAGSALTLGDAAAPSQITLGTTAGPTTLRLDSPAGTGTTVVNDAIVAQNFGGTVLSVTVVVKGGQSNSTLPIPTPAAPSSTAAR